MDIPEPKINFRRIAAMVLVIVVLAVAVGIVWKSFGKKQNVVSGPVNYVIPGVPYFGIYNHTGKFSQVFHDKDSAVASVLEYWNPGESDFQKINRAVDSREKNLTDMMNFINGIGGMKAEIKVLSLAELRNYISPRAATPLLAFFAVDESHRTESRYYPAKVLIGLKESEKKIVFHDYWLGNNYEISFDEYGKLLEKTFPRLRNKYLVIQPVDLAGKLKEIKKREPLAYPARTGIMKNAEAMFKNYAQAVPFYYDSQYDLAADYFAKVISDPGFEEFFPPQYKVRAYGELAEMQLGKGDLDAALENVQKAIAMNQNLDQPFKDWPGYELNSNAPGHFGEITRPHRVLGDIYMARKNYQKAAESYGAALVIRPDNSKAAAGLAAAEEALNQK